MDPFSIVVGITGLICFGTRVTTAARDLFRNWTDAPEGVNQALQDVESLVDLLRDLKEFFNVSNLQNSKAAADERHKFRPVVKQCENVLKELEFVVKAYVDMKSPLSRNLRWARGGKQYYESIGRMIEPLKSTLMCKLALTRATQAPLEHRMIKVESSMEVMNKKLDELLARSKQPVAAKSSSQALDNKNTEVKDWFRSAISYAGSVIGEMSAQSACGDSDSVVIERAVLSPNISRLLHHTESTRRPLAEIPREMPSDPPRYSEALRAVVPVPTRPQPEARPSHEIRVDEGGGHNDQNRTSSRDTPTDRPQSVIVNELFSSLVESRGWNRFPPEILQKFHGFSLAQKWHLIDQDPQQQKQLEIVTKQAIQAQLRRASNKRAAVSPANVPENFKKVSWDLQAKPKPKPKIVPTTYAAYHSKRRVDGKIGRLSYPEKQLIREIDGLDGECSLEHQLCDVLTSKQLHAVYDIYRRVVQKETDTSVEWVVMQVRSHARQRHVFLVDTRLVSYVDVFLRRASKDGSSSMEFECGARKSIRIVDEY